MFIFTIIFNRRQLIDSLPNIRSVPLLLQSHAFSTQLKNIFETKNTKHSKHCIAKRVETPCVWRARAHVLVLHVAASNEVSFFLCFAFYSHFWRESSLLPPSKAMRSSARRRARITNKTHRHGHRSRTHTYNYQRNQTSHGHRRNPTGSG